MTEIHLEVWKMRKIDGCIHFQSFGKLEKINSRDHLGWEINDPDSPGFWPEIV
jgi:hypothetical protein